MLDYPGYLGSASFEDTEQLLTYNSVCNDQFLKKLEYDEVYSFPRKELIYFKTVFGCSCLPAAIPLEMTCGYTCQPSKILLNKLSGRNCVKSNCL